MMLCVSVCSAEDIKLDDGIAKIYAIQPEIRLNESYNTVPTRGEFVKILSKVAVKNLYTADKAMFPDTEKDEELNNCVYTAMSFGAVSENNKFYPNDEVTYDQAIKMAVCALGYNNIVQAGSDWAAAYNAAAEKAGITNGVSREFTRRDMYVLFGNMLSAKIVVKDMLTDEYFLDPDETIMSKIHEIYFVDGIVNSDGIAALYEDIDVNEDRITVGTHEYDNPYGIRYLGYNVRGYYKEVNDTPTMLYAYPKRNDVAEVGEFEKTENNTIKDSKKKYRLYAGYTTILNGKTAYIDDFSKYAENKDVEMKLLDNNGDGLYDIIFIDYAQYNIISNVSVAEKKIYDKNGAVHMIDMSDDEAQCEIYDITESGISEIELADLLAGDTLMYYASDDNLYIRVYRFNGTVSGRITALNNKEVSLNDTAYNISDYAKQNYTNIKVGTDVSAVISPNGTFVAFSYADVSRRYAWVMRVANDDDTETLTMKVFDQDETAKLYQLADKVRVDGKAMKYGSELIGAVSGIMNMDERMVKYKLNDDGKIAVIDFAAEYNDETPLVYDKDEDNNFTHYCHVTDGWYRYRCPMFAPYFAVSTDALTFAVPKKESDRLDEKNYYIIDYIKPYQSFEHNKYYEISAYEFDENGRSKISVYFTADKKTQIPEEVGVVSSVREGIDSGGEARPMVSIYNEDGTYKTYFASDDTEDVVSALKKGDIVSYTARDETLSRIDRNYDLKGGKLSADGAGAYGDFKEGYLYSLGGGIMYTMSREAMNKSNITFSDLELHDITSYTFIFVDVIKDHDGNVINAIPRYKPVSEAKTYLSAGTDADYVITASRYSENAMVFVYSEN